MPTPCRHSRQNFAHPAESRGLTLDSNRLSFNRSSANVTFSTLMRENRSFCVRGCLPFFFPFPFCSPFCWLSVLGAGVSEPSRDVEAVAVATASPPAFVRRFLVTVSSAVCFAGAAAGFASFASFLSSSSSELDESELESESESLELDFPSTSILKSSFFTSFFTVFFSSSLSLLLLLLLSLSLSSLLSSLLSLFAAAFSSFAAFFGFSSSDSLSLESSLSPSLPLSLSLSLELLSAFFAAFLSSLAGFTSTVFCFFTTFLPTDVALDDELELESLELSSSDSVASVSLDVARTGDWAFAAAFGGSAFAAGFALVFFSSSMGGVKPQAYSCPVTCDVPESELESSELESSEELELEELDDDARVGAR